MKNNQEEKWNASQWKHDFNDPNNDYYSFHELRKDVYKNTIENVMRGFYVSENGKTVDFPNDSRMISGTRFYNCEFNVNDVPAIDGETVFEVVKGDCLLEGKRLKDNGFNPAVLNMASHRNPGGGVYEGSGAQEENLFRRSNLFRSMYQFARYAGEYGLKNSVYHYPLDYNWGGVYTPDAVVFRGLESDGYPLLDEYYTMSFIAVAAISHPELDYRGMIVDDLVKVTKNKIRTILRIGLKNGHDALVLSAFGCGAFKNPPAHMAKLFHEVFEESEFKNKFKHVSFAIIEDHNSGRGLNPNGNFLPFYEEFGQ